MLTIEEYNSTLPNAKSCTKSGDRGVRRAGGLCIAMGIVTLVLGTAVGVGSIVTGAILRSRH